MFNLDFDMYDVLGILSMGLYERPEKKKEEEVYHAQQITPKKYNFRPQTLEEYIGQSRAKELVELNIEKIKTIKPVHFIISGTKGTGKSTLAYIIANMLGYEISTYVAGSFTMDNLKEFLLKNENDTKPNILFVDEIHGLDKSIGEFMYPLLEDFLLAVGNVHVKPFIFIGATTDLNVLQKKLAPMIDRCGACVNLEHYTSEDIKQILIQYNEKVFQKNIEREVFDVLSKNVRYTPRIALSIFDDYVVCKSVSRVLSAHRIVKDSLTTDDLIILKHLADIDKPTGVEVLSIITQQTKQDFTLLQEPFLIMEGLISRTSRGRIITSKGRAVIGEVQNAQ